jgi:hypothetical protein
MEGIVVSQVTKGSTNGETKRETLSIEKMKNTANIYKVQD